nr:nuclear transport factor 2 family protein [Acuticoccus mangrovi]
MGQAAELAIEKQIKRFYVALDSRDFDVMAAVMTPDGCWRRAGKDLRGREGLLAAMDKRGTDRHSRHLLSNVLVDVADDGTAAAQFYSTAFVYTGDDLDDRGAAPMDLPSSIGVYQAKFRYEGDTWLMADLRSTPAFKRRG